MEVTMVANNDMITGGLTIMTDMVTTINLGREAIEIGMTLEQRILKRRKKGLSKVVITNAVKLITRLMIELQVNRDNHTCDVLINFCFLKVNFKRNNYSINRLCNSFMN